MEIMDLAVYNIRLIVSCVIMVLGHCGDVALVKYFNMMTRVAIVRCSRDHYRDLWSAMTLLRVINNITTVISVLHVAG